MCTIKVYTHHAINLWASVGVCLRLVVKHSFTITNPGKRCPRWCAPRRIRSLGLLTRPGDGPPRIRAAGKCCNSQHFSREVAATHSYALICLLFGGVVSGTLESRNRNLSFGRIPAQNQLPIPLQLAFTTRNSTITSGLGTRQPSNQTLPNNSRCLQRHETSPLADCVWYVPGNGTWCSHQSRWVGVPSRAGESLLRVPESSGSGFGRLSGLNLRFGRKSGQNSGRENRSSIDVEHRNQPTNRERVWVARVRTQTKNASFRVFSWSGARLEGRDRIGRRFLQTGRGHFLNLTPNSKRVEFWNGETGVPVECPGNSRGPRSSRRDPFRV